MAQTTDNWEIPELRLRRIEDLVNFRGAVSVSEISELLEISESTVRRDLQKLSELGIVRRSHGGALSLQTTSHEFMFNVRIQQNREEKIEIGRYAIQFIKPGQSVIFDSSSTVLAAVEAFAEKPLPIIAVTNDIIIAAELSKLPNVQLHVTGGENRPDSFTLYGSHAQSFINTIHVDLALMGIHAISGINLSDTSTGIADMKKAILGSSHRVILLADYSKFGPDAFVSAGNLTSVDDLVTNKWVDNTFIDTIRRESKETKIHLV